MKKLFEKAWLIALFVIVLSGIGIAAYNSPWVRTQALYLNDVLVTSTAAELNLLDAVTLSGVDAEIITGTAGTANYTAKWDTNGDLIDGYALIDDDTMGTASATNIASGESIKAYVDSSVAPNTKYINATLTDISSSGSAYLVMPTTGTITRSTGVLGSSITGVDGKINLSAYGSAMGTMTVYSSSAAGTVSYINPTAISVAKGTAITLQSYGSSTGTATEYITLEVTPAATVLSKYVVGEIADVSTGASSWVTAPVAGTIENIWTVIDGAIASVNAGVSFEIGGVAVTGGGITIAFSGSGAGTVDTSAPTALNTVTQGQAIEIITDGASTNAVKATVIFEILPS